MPLKVAPDPQNPGGWIWVDSTTGQPAAQPGGPGTAFVTQPAASTIAPATAAPATPAAATTTSTDVPTDAPPGGYTLEDLIAQNAKELNDARNNVDTLANALPDAQKEAQDAATSGDVARMQAASKNLDQLYSSMASANARLGAAAQSRAVTLTKAITDQKLQPTQIEQAQAAAEASRQQAAEAGANSQKILSGIPGEQALAAAQSKLAAANAGLADAQATDLTNKGPAEIAQINANAAELQSRADQAGHQIGLIDAQAKTQDQVTRKTGAEATTAEAAAAVAPRTAEATATSLETAAQKGKQELLTPEQQAAVNAQAPLQAQANVSGTEAAAAANQANAKQTAADVLAKKLGPAYGLQEQLDALRPILQQVQQHVFGPGGSGDPNEANDLLNQYVTATLGGDKLGTAAQNLGTLQNTAYGTAAGMANQITSSNAARASSLASFGGTALGQLAQMNANAPAGSTAMAGAFSDLMNNMQSRVTSPAFAPAAQPAAPSLPSYFQQFAGKGPPMVGAGSAAGMVGGAPATPGGPAAQPTTVAPVTINVGGTQGQPATTMPQTQPVAPQPATTTTGDLASSGMQQVGMGLPSMLQQHAPATMDYLHQLWGNELGSGAVKSPFGNTVGALA